MILQIKNIYRPKISKDNERVLFVGIIIIERVPPGTASGVSDTGIIAPHLAAMLTLQNYKRYNYPMITLAIMQTCITAVIVMIAVWLFAQAFLAALPSLRIYLAAWFAIALTAAYWYVPIMSLFLRSRRPIKEERIIISHALEVLHQHAGINRLPKIWMMDYPLINAACRGQKTMMMSTGVLTQLSIKEIAAVLAHEHGHHLSKDTMASATIAFVSLINHGLIMFGKGLMYSFKRLSFKGWIVATAIIIFLCWIKYFPPLFIFAAYVFPAAALITLNKLIAPIELWISRRTEYRQDAYEHHIGLGEHLRSALLKTTIEQPPPLFHDDRLRSAIRIPSPTTASAAWIN